VALLPASVKQRYYEKLDAMGKGLAG
jgi:hypothetical protein